MPKAKLTHWETAFKIISGVSLIGVLGVAVTVGIYMNKVDRLESLYDISKDIASMRSDIAVLQERTKGSNAPEPFGPIRPTAGKQR